MRTARRRALAARCASLVVGVVLVGAATAQAERPPTLHDREEWALRIGDALGLTDYQLIDPYCIRGRVSTVNDRWAVAVYRPDDTGCDPLADGYFVMHVVKGFWNVALHATASQACGAGPAPARVGQDLHVAPGQPLCREPGTYLKCTAYSAAGAFMVTKVRPGACSTVKPNQVHAQGDFLRRIHWTGWGRATARARATIYAVQGARFPARLVAYRRRRGCGGYVYTRLRVTASYGSSTKFFSPHCRGDGR